MNIHVLHFYVDIYSVLLRLYLRMELLGQMVILWLTSWGTNKLFLVPLMGPIFSYPHQHLFSIFCLFYLSYFSACEVLSHCGFTYLVINDIDHLFECLLAQLCGIYGQCLLIFLAQLLIGLTFCFLLFFNFCVGFFPVLVCFGLLWFGLVWWC